MSVDDFLKRYIEHDIGCTYALLFAIAFYAIDKGLININELNKLEKEVYDKGLEMSHKP